MTTACPRAPCGEKKKKQQQHTDPHGEEKKKKSKHGMTVTWVRFECRACTASVVYHFCSENRLPKILFSNPFPKNAQIVNLKLRIGFDPKNPPRVLILWIHDPFLDLPPKTQNPFLDSEIRIWIFPQKRTHICQGMLLT